MIYIVYDNRVSLFAEATNTTHLSKRYQRANYWLATSLYYRRRSHAVNPELGFIHHKIIDHIYGKITVNKKQYSAFHYINGNTGMFIVGDYSRKDKLARSCVLSDYSRLCFTKVRNEPQGEVVDVFGNSIEFSHKGMGITLKKRIILPDNVEYNGKYSMEKDAILSCVTDGYFTTQYFKAGSGRVYGHGFGNPQYWPKELRYQLMEGCYQLDIVNAHPTILYHRADSDLVNLKKYVESPEEVREDISNLLGLTVKETKTLLISHVYGSGDKGKVKILLPDDFASLSDYDKALKVSESTRKIEEFKNHPKVKPLLDDIKTASDELMKKETGKDRYSLKNCSDTIQGIEFKAITEVLNQKSPEIPLHDGVIMKNDVIDQKQAEIRMQHTLGIPLKLTKVRY